MQSFGRVKFLVRHSSSAVAKSDGLIESAIKRALCLCLFMAVIESR